MGEISTDDQLILDPEDMGGLIEAIHDQIFRRLRTGLLPQSRGYTFNYWQESVDDLVRIYTKAMLHLKELAETFAVNVYFMNNMQLSQEIWDLLALVTKSESWEDIPFHPRGHPCDICRELSKTE